MSRGAGIGVIRSLGFPRVSGDEPDARKRWDQICKFSPRERG